MTGYDRFSAIEEISYREEQVEYAKIIILELSLEEDIMNDWFGTIHKTTENVSHLPFSNDQIIAQLTRSHNPVV